MSFASKLQEIRQNNEISQETLAELLGVSRQSVSKWERGKGYPEIDKLIFISEHFNISLDELLKEKKNDSVIIRKPINLTKTEDRNVTEEIYPCEESFHHTVVSGHADLAQYGNYTCQAQSGKSVKTSASGKIKKRIKQRLGRYWKLISAGIFGGIAVSVIIIGINSNFSKSSSEVYTGPYYYDETIAYYAENYSQDDYEDGYNLRFMLDEMTGTRYIFNADDNRGLATSFDDQINNYTKLTEPETGNTYYCAEYYFNECVVVTPVNSYPYVIPNYMVYSCMEVEHQHDYEVCVDENTKQSFFIPKYILEQCEISFGKKSEEESSDIEINDSPEEQIEEAEENETPEFPESQY